jgi:hypothetical protein
MIQGSFFNSMKLLAKMATPKTVRNRAGQTRSGFDIDGLGEEGPPPEITVLSYKMPTPIRINADPAIRQPITTAALPRLALNFQTRPLLPINNRDPKPSKMTPNAIRPNVIESTPPSEAAENVPTMNTAMPTTISKGINTPDTKVIATTIPQDNHVPNWTARISTGRVPLVGQNLFAQGLITRNGRQKSAVPIDARM